MHSPGPPAADVAGAGEAGVDVAGAGDDGGGVDADAVGDWLACPVAGVVVVWDCGWLGPHAVSSSAAAAAAVVKANPWEIF
ncbi:hypothetical protein [Pseudarthrobacter niigatensis]|uniref:Uncharacterized protein n=1 Tax=Pseudarthrobacter niigatensis TaxID=369935 RepID=A0AAJ1WDX1_9MICC|nr:hypothetical protein [Pseudarthrobacter niigatensis]MDQ0146669.1 hypothetical protein [Pseudarthrobacter niigatensis]MDQ0266834.1 hypothetical protein [Pseudarthrobacter niigatensis]